MEEIKVEEYVRTKSGNIGKVLDITNVTMQKRKKYLIKWNISKAYYITAIRIIKHSPNIIDLIEEGDYVNGYKIDYDFEIITNEITGNKSIVYRNDIDRVNQIYDWSIKSIVTKEMFNQVKYEV